MSSIDAINALILNPAYAPLLALVKGARNGFVYGVKVRFPHALVMAILFGKGDWISRANMIFQATKTHALNLAKYCTIYKALLLLQRRANGGKEKSADTFIAGCIGAYFVFGERTAINEQIVLYVASRVIASLIPRDRSQVDINSTVTRPLPPNSKLFTAFATLAWGSVMWMFRHHPEGIQPGLFSSMTYIYEDSDKWNDLRTLLWHNT